MFAAVLLVLPTWTTLTTGTKIFSLWRWRGASYPPTNLLHGIRLHKPYTHTQCQGTLTGFILRALGSVMCVTVSLISQEPFIGWSVRKGSSHCKELLKSQSEKCDSNHNNMKLILLPLICASRTAIPGYAGEAAHTFCAAADAGVSVRRPAGSSGWASLILFCKKSHLFQNNPIISHQTCYLLLLCEAVEFILNIDDNKYPLEGALTHSNIFMPHVLASPFRCYRFMSLRKWDSQLERSYLKPGFTEYEDLLNKKNKLRSI